MDQVVAFIQGNEAVIAAAVVAVLDLAIALVPSWKANGILHFILLQAQSIANKPQTPPAP